MASVRQYPTPPNEWLHDGAKDHTRLFRDFIIRNADAEPWKECTNAEKEQWELEHPAPIVEEKKEAEQ